MISSVRETRSYWVRSQAPRLLDVYPVAPDVQVFGVLVYGAGGIGGPRTAGGWGLRPVVRPRGYAKDAALAAGPATALAGRGAAAGRPAAARGSRCCGTDSSGLLPGPSEFARPLLQAPGMNSGSAPCPRAARPARKARAARPDVLALPARADRWRPHAHRHLQRAETQHDVRQIHGLLADGEHYGAHGQLRAPRGATYRTEPGRAGVTGEVPKADANKFCVYGAPTPTVPFAQPTVTITKLAPGSAAEVRGPGPAGGSIWVECDTPEGAPVPVCVAAGLWAVGPST